MDYQIDTSFSKVAIVYAVIVFVWIIVRIFLLAKKRTWKEDRNEIISATISGLVWAITYLFIRRQYNPDVKDMYIHSDDAIFGGLAAFAATLFKPLVKDILDHFLP